MGGHRPFRGARRARTRKRRHGGRHVDGHGLYRGGGVLVHPGLRAGTRLFERYLQAGQHAPGVELGTIRPHAARLGAEYAGSDAAGEEASSSPPSSSGTFHRKLGQRFAGGGSGGGSGGARPSWRACFFGSGGR